MICENSEAIAKRDSSEHGVSKETLPYLTGVEKE
jgi:hypothetical protein